MATIAEIAAQVEALKVGAQITTTLEVPQEWVAEVRIQDFDVMAMALDLRSKVTRPGSPLPPITPDLLDKIRSGTLIGFRNDEAMFIEGMIEALKQLVEAGGKYFTFSHTWGDPRLTIVRTQPLPPALTA